MEDPSAMIVDDLAVSIEEALAIKSPGNLASSQVMSSQTDQDSLKPLKPSAEPPVAFETIANVPTQNPRLPDEAAAFDEAIGIPTAGTAAVEDNAPSLEDLRHADTIRAENYVADLFRVVLRRDQTSEVELSYWINYLRNTQDPISLFTKFIESDEYRLRCEQDAASTTMFPAGHFYSPAIDVRQVAKDQDRIFSARGLTGIAMNADAQVDLFGKLAQHFDSMPFQDQPKAGTRYHYDNTSYGFGDACIYWAMIGHFRPKRLIEVGSGFTSGLALDAIEHFKTDTVCTFIEPFPSLLRSVAGELPTEHMLIDKPVQEIDLSLLDELQDGDFLFIDSSHVVKTGSDVHFEITEMLPRLREGVIVHFHDMFYPFEYPRDWVLDDNKSWNELYFLHSFLMFNSAFDIIYFNDFVAKSHSDVITRQAERWAVRMKLNPGGGLWLRRSELGR